MLSPWAREYISNWKTFIGPMFGNDKSILPHGFFVPFTDIMELYKLQREVTHLKTAPRKDHHRIYIVGIRAYYCIEKKLEDPLPISTSAIPVKAVLVAVYQVNPRVEDSPWEYDYDKHHPTFDLVIQVASTLLSSWVRKELKGSL